MKRLSVRLVLSHVFVAVLGAIATYVVVRQLAPSLFDESMRRMGMGMGRPGQGGTTLRDQFAEAVDRALLVGALVGATAAAIFGVVASYRLVRPLGRVRAAYTEVRIDDQAAGDGVTLDDLDGLTVSGPGWWFNVRPSNTEPLLRLNAEAADEEKMVTLRDGVLAIVRS